MNFVLAVAYHFCLALPAAITQPGAHLLAEPSNGFPPSFLTSDSEPREEHPRREGGDLADVEAAVAPPHVAHVEPPVVGVPEMDGRSSISALMN